MRFLLLNQFYPPDVAPTGKYLHDLAQSLVRRGHDVEVLCSRRSYDGKNRFPRREILDGVEVTRLAATGFGRRGFDGKILDYASFYAALIVALTFRRRPDLIFSLTTPPYIGLLGKLAAKRYGCEHAHWVMDLYPDVLFAHGMAKRGGMFTRLLRRLTRFQFRGAKCVLALGPIMANRVAAYIESRFTFHVSRSTLNSQLSTLCWVPLWSDPKLTPWPEQEISPARKDRGWNGNDVVFLYSGNMGLGHRFGEFLNAAKQLGVSGPRWVFAGTGKRASEIEIFSKSNPDAGIKFMDYAPNGSLCAHLSAADVHLASLDSAWQGLIVPSKLQSSFAVARPVLYVGGRECETAAWIRESGGGWTVDEGDINGLIAASREALDAGERRKRGQAALKFARKHFQMQENCSRIAKLLEQPI